jgi:predicted RNA-binding Zn-ribbon protein involved in translation (DUF1610 family)
MDIDRAGMTSPKYPVADLVVGAAFVSNMNEFLNYLGVEVTPSRRREMWARLSNYRIDVSHWSRTPRGSYSREELADAVARATSIAGVMRHLGIRPAGGSHFHISQRIKREGLDTSHFLGQAYARGKLGKRKTASEILVVRPEGSSRTDGSRLRRAMNESGVPYACAICGCDAMWLGTPLTLAVDHINGDWLDNRLANLRFLCPNCHAQTSTWCRKKGP